MSNAYNHRVYALTKAPQSEPGCGAFCVEVEDGVARNAVGAVCGFQGCMLRHSLTRSIPQPLGWYA